MWRRSITLNRPYLPLSTSIRVLSVLRSGRLAQGSEVKKFESLFAELHGGGEAIAMNSGTSALYSVIMALGLSQEDEVIVPAFTFAATANAVKLAGATPKFADVNLETMNMDANNLESAFDRARTKAVIFVPLFGNPEGLVEVAQFCQKYGVDLILDAAQAHLSEFAGMPIASYAKATVFSFYPTKNMTTMEGGLVLTNDDSLANFLRQFRNQGMEKRYQFRMPGMNFRLTEVQAVIGIHQLGKLKTWTKKRIDNARILESKVQGVKFQKSSSDATHVYHQLTFCSSQRTVIQQRLLQDGIESDVYYPEPVPCIPHFKDSSHSQFVYKNAATLSATVLSIPVHQNLSRHDLKRISRSIEGSLL